MAETDEALETMMTRRYPAAWTWMVANGAVTMEIGAVGSGIYARYGLMERGSAEQNRPVRFEHTIRQLPILRIVLVMTILTITRTTVGKARFDSSKPKLHERGLRDPSRVFRKYVDARP